MEKLLGPGPPLVGAFFGPKENQMKCLIIASIMFGVAMLTVPGPAAAQFSAAQQAACGGDAQRLCSSSMADPRQLSACMNRNASKVSAGCKAAMGGGGKKKKRG
jgi:hypothetical protein